MQILNNSLLNILIPNDNKALKEVLQQADTKTLEQMVNNKSVNVNEVLKNLIEQLKTGEKSNSNIENILKNSNFFKELGSFSKNIESLLKNLEQNSSNESMQNLKTSIENLFKNIKDLDATNLKEQLKNSGVFLESKISQNASLNSKVLDNLLTQIQSQIKNMDPNQTKVLNEIISKLQNPNLSQNEQITNLKSLLTNLQNLSKSLSSNQTANLNNLTNQLQNIIKDASLVESKIQNNIPQTNLKEQINQTTKELLTQIKNEISQNSNLASNKTLKNDINTLLKTNDFFSKNTNLLEPKAILNTIANSSELKTLSSVNPNISNIVLNLKNIAENIYTLENKTLNMQNISEEKPAVLQNIKETISNLKAELANVKNIDLTNLNQLVSKLDNLQTLFSKVEVANNPLIQNLQTPTQNSFMSNFLANINSLFLSLKESIVSLDSNTQNLDLQNQLNKTISKIETLIKDVISNPNILKNETSLNSDMKSILLTLNQELAGKNDPTAQEMLRQVDRLLTQIDYQQLNSLVSNSNSLYVPFFWDMLEEGSIEMKQTEEDKFYCQINLTLKDFGKVDLMLGLYDKNKLDLTIQAQREHFKTKIRDNLQQLKQALNGVDLIPVNIRLLDLQEENTKSVKTDVYSNNFDNNLDLGLDIRA